MHPWLSENPLPGGYPSPSSRQYPAYGLPSAGSFPLLPQGQPQVASNALRGNANWAMPSALSLGQRRGEDEEQGREQYIGVRTLPSKAGVVVYMANLGKLFQRHSITG